MTGRDPISRTVKKEVGDAGARSFNMLSNMREDAGSH